jgi:hypothetical protein
VERAVDAARRHVARLHAAGQTALVQPYLPAVDAGGETALVFFGSRFSHAVAKGPVLELIEPAVFLDRAPAEAAERFPSELLSAAGRAPGRAARHGTG